MSTRGAATAAISLNNPLPFRQWMIVSGDVGFDENEKQDYRYFRMAGFHKETNVGFACNVPVWLLTKELSECWLRAGTSFLEGAVPDFDQIKFENGSFTLPLHTSQGLKAFKFDLSVPPGPNWEAMHEIGKLGWRATYDPNMYHPEVATKLAYYFARSCTGDPALHWNKCGCPRFKTYQALDTRVDDWFRSIA